MAESRVLVIGAAILILLSSSVAGDWTPALESGSRPDSERGAGRHPAGRYADALAKQVWFHENALKYSPAMYGVRLSFALSYWLNSPTSTRRALTKLRAVRDDAATRVRSGVGPRDAFIDFAAINRELKEEGQTGTCFSGSTRPARRRRGRCSTSRSRR